MWLAIASRPIRTAWIVFDNLESVDAIRDYLPDPSANPHILVTSRSEQPEFTDVKLELLDEEQSYLMLVQEADRSPKNKEEESAAREIVAALGGLPLALELAGAYLAHRPIGWCAYRDLLRENLKQALPTQLASLTRHEADLFKTLRVSEQEISEEPLLVEVLDLLTWSSSSPMSLRLMAHLLDVHQTRLYGALGLGKALRLLQEVPDSERYAVHRLVQEVRQKDRPLAQRSNWVSVIAQRLGDWFETIRNDFRELPVLALEFEHLRAWQVHAELSSPIASVRLLWLQAYPAYHRGRYDEAHRILQQALAEYEVKKLDSQPLKANLLHDIAYILHSKGAIHESLRVGGEALQIRRDCFGDKHPDVAMSLSLLAGIHQDIGDFPRAPELGKQALEMQRELLGGKHPDVANSLNNLAGYYGGLGDHHRALELCNQALEMQRELLGEKHPYVATSLNNLAHYHAKPGDYPRALELGKQALEMRRELLGDKHPDIANSLNTLAFAYEKHGNHARALELGEQALEMRRELLGENHPDTVNSLRFFAERLYANPSTAGRGKALVEEFLRHIPHDHPSRAEVLSFLSSRKGFRAPGKIGHSKKRKKK
jgi:tetratricopeptide (TPR) repeat protein